MLKASLQFAAIAAALIAPVAGLAAFDQSETTQRYTIGTTWSGDRAVFEYQDGRLFRGTDAKTIGLFYSGRPRLVAFGCNGAEAVLIALEESDLPACQRIEKIDGAQAIQWAD